MAARLKPRIGISGPSEGGWIARGLSARAIRRAGGAPVQLHAGTSLAGLELDGLVLGGGRDVDPELYGGERSEHRLLDTRRDAFELSLLDVVEARGLPLLAICRGAQLWNVARKGTLIPDVSALRGSGGSRRRLRSSWPVTLEPDSRLAGVLGRLELDVNRLHTQAIDTLGHGLRVAARDRFGIVQAIESHDARFGVGVQWHPELLPRSPVQARLWSAFVAAASPNARGRATAAARPRSVR
jgi:putative glutamine amidotransferase